MLVFFPEDSQQIIEAAKKWESAFNAGNFDLLTSYYADGAVLLPPQGPRLTDRESKAGSLF